MARAESDMKQHILSVTEQMLNTGVRSDIRIRDVAESANVGIPTIYYYFETRDRLIAEAQMSRYFKLLEPIHGFILTAEYELSVGNESNFLSALGEVISVAWSIGRLDDGWMLVKILMDVCSEPVTKSNFDQIRDSQILRWIDVLQLAQHRGWLDNRVQIVPIVLSCWSGVLGQATFADSTIAIYTPETIRDFYINSVRSCPGLIDT